jgi:two-component system OmpR family sensor kinase
MAGLRRRGWPMISLVLAVMLASVFAVQIGTFVLLQVVPLPEPPMFTVSQVARALATGSAGAGEFRFSLHLDPPAARFGRARRLAPAIARALHVAPEAVRLTFLDPPHMNGHGPPPRGREREFFEENAGSLLVGDFAAAVRRQDGRWLVVQPIRSGVYAWRMRLLFWLIAALVTVTPFAWLLARWVTRPVTLFAHAAERIGRNPRTPPLAEEGPAEIVYAAHALNDMQQRLNRYIDDRTVMIGAIAHDLRTPLMRLALRLERAPDEVRRGAERDMADMQAMIAAATDYVRGTTYSGPRRRLDLRSLAESAVDDLADRGERVSIVPGGPVVVEGDPVALRTVIDNLLGNAVRYAGDAELTVAEETGAATLEVRDHGDGIPDADLERAFEPFYRTERSRNRETGGIGLGLASVRGVVHQHGGEATLRNHPDGGLVARVSLPV